MGILKLIRRVYRRKCGGTALYSAGGFLLPVVIGLTFISIISVQSADPTLVEFFGKGDMAINEALPEESTGLIQIDWRRLAEQTSIVMIPNDFNAYLFSYLEANDDCTIDYSFLRTALPYGVHWANTKTGELFHFEFLIDLIRYEDFKKKNIYIAIGGYHNSISGSLANCVLGEPEHIKKLQKPLRDEDLDLFKAIVWHDEYKTIEENKKDTYRKRVAMLMGFWKTYLTPDTIFVIVPGVEEVYNYKYLSNIVDASSHAIVRAMEINWKTGGDTVDVPMTEGTATDFFVELRKKLYEQNGSFPEEKLSLLNSLDAVCYITALGDDPTRGTVSTGFDQVVIRNCGDVNDPKPLRSYQELREEIRNNSGKVTYHAKYDEKRFIITAVSSTGEQRAYLFTDLPVLWRIQKLFRETFGKSYSSANFYNFPPGDTTNVRYIFNSDAEPTGRFAFGMCLPSKAASSGP